MADGEPEQTLEERQETLFGLDSFVEPDPTALLSVVTPSYGDTRHSLKPLHIRRVWCRNFKGFSEVELFLDDFSVLVGTNSSGKSSLLQAISLAHRLILLHAHIGESEVSFPLSEGRLLLPDVLPVAISRDLWHRGQQRVGRSRHVGVEVGVEYENGYKFEFSVRALFGSLNSRVVDSPGGIPRSEYNRLLHRPPVIVPAAVGVVVEEEYRTPARLAGLLASGRPNETIRNHLNELSATDPEGFAAIKEILETHFAAHIDRVDFKPESDQFISAVYADSTVEHDLFSAGGGFLQVLQLLVFAYSYNAGLLALDEPDAHLHSSLQQIVVGILESLSARTGCQILLATHSKEIINFVDSGRLIPVRKGEPTLAHLRPYQGAIELLQDVGAVDNVDAYSLILSKRCLFVEGGSDERYLKRFAAKLGAGVFEGDTKVVMIPTSGVTETRHLQQLDLFEQLIGRGEIASLQVVDRDGLPAALLDAATENAARPYHVLARDSVENYLLIPEAIMRVINSELARRGDNRRVDIDEVVAEIESACDELRDAMVDRSTDSIERFHLARRTQGRPNASAMAAEARQHVANAFDSFEGKISVVQGRRLLGILRGRFQDIYQVSFSNDHIIEEISRDEVPLEIQDLVRQLEALPSTSP
jgi:predicted ATPase